MKSLLLLLFIFAANFNLVYAQSDKKKTEQTDYSNSFEPYAPKKVTVTKKKIKKKKKEVTFKEVYVKSLEQKKKDFQELMIANAKKRKKAAKELRKPQYSNPLYFGHKKKPKKRPVGKRKMCKECGIVH